MRNKDISRTLKLMANLLELHGHDADLVRTFASAAFQVGRLDKPLHEVPPDQIGRVAVIRKPAALATAELLGTGTIKQLEDLVAETPPGILDLFSLKGIGPKKIGLLWKELGIESPGELLYACRENRLTGLKGFGAKTQQQIIESIEFRQAGDGSVLYAMAEETADRLLSTLCDKYPGDLHALTGEIYRREITIRQIEILTTVKEPDLSQFINPLSLNMTLIYTDRKHFYQELIRTSSLPEHLEGWKPASADAEEDVYRGAGITYIPAELRNYSTGDAEKLLSNASGRLLETSDLKGILHVHSTYSDGINTLEEMAVACRDKGYEYLGICDHSKAAFYAGGLKPEEVLEQQEEIARLNEKLSPFRIFSGIESDILSDGSLDYPDEILRRFDFIVASVHSNLKMQQDKAMMRLLRAIENPFTTILGHMTGRLLLSRPGYPVDHRIIIDACAANGVVIEINANPHRLDMDWTWIPYALEKGVKLSVNPDAHSMAEIDFVHFGVLAARKGGLYTGMTLNCLGTEGIAHHFSSRKQN